MTIFGPPPWNKAPDWANWLAMDEDGKWHWYSEEPMNTPTIWLGGGDFEEEPDYRNGDRFWKDTLEQRPENYMDGDWHEPLGDDCPVPPYTPVTVRMSSGSIERGVAGDWNWVRSDYGSHRIDSFRVRTEEVNNPEPSLKIAYKIEPLTIEVGVSNHNVYIINGDIETMTPEEARLLSQALFEASYDAEEE